MGRKKLPIRRISHAKDRVVTFCKRRVGLLKKAAELAILCDVGVYLVFTDEQGAVHQFNTFPLKSEPDPPCRAALSLQNVLDKVAVGNFIPFKLDNYPFSGLEHHHNLDEFHRYDDFVSQIKLLMDQKKEDSSLVKRPPIKVKEMTEEEKLESKKMHHPFPQRQEVKIQRQAAQLRGFETSESLMHVLQGPLYAEGDGGDASITGNEDMDLEQSEEIENKLKKFKRAFEEEQQEFFSSRNFNLIKNESSVIDLLIFTLIMNKYFTKAVELEEQNNSPKGNPIPPGFEILRLATVSQAMDIAANLSLKLAAKDESKLNDLQMITEYFLRLYVNPHLGKSKQANLTLLNGVVTVVRSYYREISNSMANLYSESVSICENRFVLLPDTVAQVHQLIERVIYTMQQIETVRQIGGSSLNPIASFQAILDRLSIHDLEGIEFKVPQIIDNSSDNSGQNKMSSYKLKIQKPPNKTTTDQTDFNNSNQQSRSLKELLKKRNKAKLKLPINVKIEEPHFKSPSRFVGSPMIIKSEHRSDSKSSNSRNSKHSSPKSSRSQTTEIQKSRGWKDQAKAVCQEPAFDNIAVNSVLAQFSPPQHRSFAQEIEAPSPQRDIRNMTRDSHGLFGSLLFRPQAEQKSGGFQALFKKSLLSLNPKKDTILQRARKHGQLKSADSSGQGEEASGRSVPKDQDNYPA